MPGRLQIAMPPPLICVLKKERSDKCINFNCYVFNLIKVPLTALTQAKDMSSFIILETGYFFVTKIFLGLCFRKYSPNGHKSGPIPNNN